MIQFKAEIEQFGQKGEKSGWCYVLIRQELAEQLKSNFKKSFRVCGRINNSKIEGMALIPMGGGAFILPLKASLRKLINKNVGDVVELVLEEDVEFKIEIPEDLLICLADEAELLDRFMGKTKGHQNYFINWINQAKTEETRIKRIAQTIQAMSLNYDYGQMIRSLKNKI